MTEPPAETISPTVTPIPVSTERENGNELTINLPGSVEMVLVRVPSGEFTMGSADSDTQASSDEKPQHTVRLDEYWIGKYEVTNAQFAAFVKATGYKTTAEKEGTAYKWTRPGWSEVAGANWRNPQGPSSNINGKENHPVVSVSWDDAVAFCKWVSEVSGKSIRLPTEAEWEKAARGSDGRTYPWGNDAPDNTRANFSKNEGGTTEVGKYSPQGDSRYDAADMAGNVWEWTSSLYKEYPYKADDGREDLNSRDIRVLRGGSWDLSPDFVRAASRDWHNPSYRFVNIGFRVVCAPVP
jgi:formylglycine-generating enzyme required for sulfatase activity